MTLGTRPCSDSEEIARSVLHPGERLLWHGRPKQGLLLRPRNSYAPVAIDASLAATALLMIVVAALALSRFFSALGVTVRVAALTAFAIAIYAGWRWEAARLLGDVRRRGATVYALTDRRVLVIDDYSQRRVVSRDIAAVATVAVQTYHGGRTTVAFGLADIPAAADEVREAAASHVESIRQQALPKEPIFEQIRDANRVYDLFRETQRQLLADGAGSTRDAAGTPRCAAGKERSERHEDTPGWLCPSEEKLGAPASSNSEAIVRALLADGEDLRWLGRPKRGLMYRRGDGIAVPVGAALLAAGVLGVAGGAPSTINLLFCYVGLYLTICSRVLDAWRRGATVYAVTGERVLIVDRFRRQTVSCDIRLVHVWAFEKHRDSTGSLQFSALPPFRGEPRGHRVKTWRGAQRSKRLTRVTWGPEPPTVPAFERIQDAERVCALFYEARKDLARLANRSEGAAGRK